VDSAPQAAAINSTEAVTRIPTIANIGRIENSYYYVV